MMVGSFVLTLVFLIKKKAGGRGGGGKLKLPLVILFFKCLFASRRGGHMHCHYGVLHYVPPLLHNEEHCNGMKLHSYARFSWKQARKKRGS
jgi:hypothetical protein